MDQALKPRGMNASGSPARAGVPLSMPAPKPRLHVPPDLSVVPPSNPGTHAFYFSCLQNSLMASGTLVSKPTTASESGSCFLSATEVRVARCFSLWHHYMPNPAKMQANAWAGFVAATGFERVRFPSPYPAESGDSVP